MPKVILLIPALALMTLVGCSIAGINLTPTPTPILTPTPFPTAGRDNIEEPPLGPGVEIGRAYAYTLKLHCGVRDAIFDDHLWMALDVPEEWKYNPPIGWTQDDRDGQMTLVEENLAVFTPETGRTIEFVPWPDDVYWGPCF